MKFRGKTALISGGSRGIGKAIAIKLAHEGANISFSYAKNKDAADALITELLALGVKVKATSLDIKDYTQVKTWVDETLAEFGTLDFVISNAGIVKDKALALMAPFDWQDVLQTNLEGTINVCRAVVFPMVKQQGGCIVNVSSVSGVVGIPRQTNYAASKAGIIGFSKALAKEVANYKIRVNCVAPGFIETDMLKDLKEAYLNKMLSQIPLARLGKSEEVADSVSFLLSDEARYITGQTIIIDGGMSLAI